MFQSFSVIPAKAGIHLSSAAAFEVWIPAFAGMTVGVFGCGLFSPPSNDFLR